MIPLASLWLPILLSAVITFLVSAIIWMALPHHKSDHAALPDEDALMDAMRAQNLKEGVYMFPFAGAGAQSKDPGYQAKLAKGPFGIIRVISAEGGPPMGGRLVASFLLYIVIGVFAAYLASRTLAPGVGYMVVFRLVATIVFICHSIAHFHDVIWFGQRWSTAFKNTADALIYGLLAGGVFGWLWPVM